MTTNRERSEAAAAAVDAFERLVFLRPGEESRQTVLGDLLCDLMHYAQAQGLAWEGVIANATAHYEGETCFACKGEVADDGGSGSRLCSQCQQLQPVLHLPI